MCLQLSTNAVSSVCDHCRCITKSGIGSVLALLCLVGNVKAGAVEQVIEGPARVIDGDTLEVRKTPMMHA